MANKLSVVAALREMSDDQFFQMLDESDDCGLTDVLGSPEQYLERQRSANGQWETIARRVNTAVMCTIEQTTTLGYRTVEVPNRIATYMQFYDYHLDSNSLELCQKTLDAVLLPDECEGVDGDLVLTAMIADSQQLPLSA